MAISPASYYYLLSNELQKTILNRLGPNGEARIPFNLYLTSEDGKKYIMHTTLWEIVKDGKLTIHTQTHGYEITKEWPR